MKQKKVFLNDPGMCVLCGVGSVGVIGAVLASYYLIMLQKGFMWSTLQEMPLYAHLFLLGCLFGWIFVMVYHRYDYFTVLHIRDDCLEFTTIATRRRMYYTEINYIGLDYGVIHGTKQFWIYYSKDPLPMKYYHNAHRIKCSNTTMRSRYDEILFESLCLYLPKKHSKELRKHYSAVRANKE